MFNAKQIESQLRDQRRQGEENDAKRRAEKRGLPYLNLISTRTPTELEAMKLVEEEEARKALLALLQIVRKKLVVAVFDPELPDTKKILDDLKKKYTLIIYVCSRTSLEHAWGYYEYLEDAKEISGRVEMEKDNILELEKRVTSIEVLSREIRNFKNPHTSQILDLILAGAMALKSSDIHLEPGEEKNDLRLRIDGILHTVYSEFPKHTYSSLVTRIKLLSSLKLNVKDEPQDGRFTIDVGDRDIEVRTSVIPSEYGETIVMRLLDPSGLKGKLEELGFREDDLRIVGKKIEEPNGLILNTGPTGSGKTTTLYAFLKHIVNPGIKIITIEDPIEYHLEGISQTQVDPSADYTFASGLRSILRQDPDIVLVGEIRDQETGEIAVNASLTGHLVLSTLHTNDAVGAIPRLLDINVKPQSLGPSLTLVIAQRLVRVLCPQCKKGKELDEEVKKKLREFLEGLPKRVDTKKYQTETVWEPGGCDACGNMGYKGRTSVFELFVISENVEKLIYENPTEIQLKEAARKEGMVFMQEDGILKVLEGKTSISEVERLTGEIGWLPHED